MSDPIVPRFEEPDAWGARLRASAPDAPFVQFPAHAAAKRATGWRPRSLVAEASPGAWTGAQLLVRRLPAGLGAIAYAPRGPVTVGPDAASAARTRAAFAAGLGSLRAEGVTLVRLELGDNLPVPAGTDEVAPPAELTEPLRAPWRAALAAAGLRPHGAGTVQPRSSRIIDLREGLDAVRAAWHPNRRRYVRQAEEAGVRVRVGDAGDAEALYLAMRSIAARKGTRARSTELFAGILQAYGDAAELAIAEGGDGRLLGALLLVRTPATMSEPFGGATDEGNRLRATASLRAHAFARAIDHGCARYDLWGLPTRGIAEFKRDWGGTAVAYGGAFDVDLDPIRGPLARLALRARGFGG